MVLIPFQTRKWVKSHSWRFLDQPTTS